MTSRDQLGILQPGRGPPNRRPSTVTHPIGAVESTLPVNQQGPLETCLAHVLLGTLPSLERYDDNAQAQSLEFVLVPSQLRQVLPAGQSAEVSVKHHQKPAAPVVLQPMDSARGVLQRKFDRRRSDMVHFVLACRDTARR